MKLALGIVGLPNVGKSTLFKLLTKVEVNIANYPFCTIDPNIGVVAVPDERLVTLTKLSKSAKTIPAVVEFYDIAGLVKGAAQGEGLGNKFLSHIKEVQAIVHVLRVFPDSAIVHVDNSVDPIRDLEVVNSELILKDLETVDRRIEKLQAEARGGSKDAIKELEIATRIKQELNRGNLPITSEDLMGLIRAPARRSLGEDGNGGIKELNLLTAKKQIVLANGGEGDVSQELKTKIAALGATYVVANLAEQPDLSALIREAYRTLNLISFFTTGEDETRAWTIERGTKAPQAAGVIHTDFENKFIRAEVVAYADFVEAGGWTQAKQKGLLRLEGKEYEVKDGDILEIRHG